MPETSEQESISELVENFRIHGSEFLTCNAFKNRQRTSVRNGILKSEAVLKFAEVLNELNIEYLQDLHTNINNERLEALVKNIPGQKSGISLRYLYMLAGSDNHIKPDRMIKRYISNIIGKEPSIVESHNLIVEAQKLLLEEFPHLTPRLLDYVIWSYQRIN